MLERRYREYKELAKKITKGDERYIDLLHDVLLQLETNEKWNSLKTKQEQMYFLTRTLTNQFYSNNSYFNKVYRRFSSEAVEIPDETDELYQEKPTLEWLNNLLENELKTNPQNWYNIGLFKMYMEYQRIEPIHNKTRIPKYSIRETIKQMKSWIKIKWEKECQK